LKLAKTIRTLQSLVVSFHGRAFDRVRVSCIESAKLTRSALFSLALLANPSEPSLFRSEISMAEPML